jgi:hypothetical protein
MWFTLDRGPSNSDGVEQLLPRLQAIVEFIDGLQRQLAAEGVDGIGGALQLYRSLRAILDPIARPEVERMHAELIVLERRLSELADALVSLKGAKTSLSRNAP